jgi:hypothetical protein
VGVLQEQSERLGACAHDISTWPLTFRGGPPPSAPLQGAAPDAAEAD